MDRLVPLPKKRREYVGGAPFGAGQLKPRHYLGMARVAWENRDQLAYAYRVLTEGTCDGCALGTIGVHDWTLEPDEVHLCMVRLELLRLNTMGPIADFEARMQDPAALLEMSSKQLRELGRLPYPMRRRAGEVGFERIGWEEFFTEAGARIRALGDPDRFALFCTSRGVTNETYYLAQKVARFLGTNNVDNSARLCHSPSTAGLKDTIGVGATTCSYRDLFKADLIVFLGSNPANDQPVALKYLLTARENGARIVTVNTYREPGMERYWVPSNLGSAMFGTPISDDFHLIHTGGDLAFLNAVQKLLIERGQVDASFIRDHTTGYEALVHSLAGQDLERLVQLSGSSFDEIERFTTSVAGARNGILVWSMGITQHEHGSDTVRAIANLGLMRGWVGREGVGLMPIRGHSGVQGGAEMGAYSTAFPGGLPINAGTAQALSSAYGFGVPSAPGLKTTEMLDAAHAGRLDVFYVIGGNFLETLPQPKWVADALSAVPVRIHQDIVLTKQMLVPARETTYLLPARTRYEQTGGGTETTTERRVILSPEVPGHPIGEALSEWEIIMRLGEAVSPERRALVHFDDGAAIRQEIARVVPNYAPIANLSAPGDQFQWGGPILCEGGEFPTDDKKGHFRVVRPPDRSIGADELRLSTRRGKQFNSMVQGDIDPLNGAARDEVLMALADAQRFALREGEEVTLYNRHGAFHGKVKLAEMRPGNIQGHWPEVNMLLPRGRIDAGGGVPDYNAMVRVVATSEFNSRR